MNCALRRSVAYAAIVSVSIVLTTSNVAAAPPTVRVLDLNNRTIDPFQSSSAAKAIVFIFTSIDCPISNRYAPDVQRLHRTYAPRGVDIWLVYPNPSDSGEAIRRHIAAFSYPTRALRDPQHLLAKMTEATVTPEAAVYDAERHLVYHGRIDNRYVNLGVERPSPTRHDLEEVLSAVVAGKPAPEAEAPAVGCFIADFVQ